MKAVLWFALAIAAAGIAWEMPDDPPRVAGITGDGVKRGSQRSGAGAGAED